MTELAFEKLREARYFLKRMRDTKESEEFKYNFSAFLSSARSVTFYLQKEHRDSPGFDEWYTEKQNEMRDSTLFSAMNQARNSIVKEGYLSILGVTIEFSKNKNVGEATISGHGTASIISEFLTPNERDVSEYRINRVDVLSPVWQQSEHRGKSLIQICDEYLDLLEAIVTEWEVEEIN